jgi:F420-dependent oxidoreductase-like protein
MGSTGGGAGAGGAAGGSAAGGSAGTSGTTASGATARRRFAETTAELADYEKAGVELITVPELYGFDAVSRLGYVAAKTSQANLSSGILQLYTRTPALLAMTAASLDDLSDGRFELGLGTSGPQVIEGFHGVPFDAPIGRTREVIEICRQVWRREPLTYSGRHYTVPLPPGQGTGLGKPLKLVDHPVRDRIPITIAAIGPQNVALAAELANGWQPPFYVPEKAAEVWGGPLREGGTRRDPALGPLDVQAGVALAIGDDVHHLHDLTRPGRALYIGGMGARGRKF